MTGLAWLFIGAVCCPMVLAEFLIVENDLDNSAFALTWLKMYGYMHQTGELSAESAEAAVLRMQNFLNLPETGKVDEETLRVMKMPRCGVPDYETAEDYGKSKRYGVFSHWKIRKLTYRIENYTPDMSRSDIEKDFTSAFTQWENACGLSFSKTDGDANIVLWFTPLKNHGGSPFGDRTLAHASFPYTRPKNGIIHFNDKTQWRPSGKTRGRDYYDLGYVALHEIGHTIGLKHSTDSTAIMAPVYKFEYANNAILHPDDIAGARSVYGN